jgi:hypothetical protein
MKTLSLESLLAGLEKDAGIEKAASVATPKPAISAELAGVLEKKAAEDITTSALAAGEELAKQLLEKLAADNEIQKSDNEIITSDNAKVIPNDTTGTITDVQMATINKGLALGGTSPDMVDKLEDKAGQTKEAQIKSENTQMAKSIMQKIAQEVGLPTTTPAAAVNTEAAVSPNLIQQSNAVMTSQDDSKVLPLPGAEGTINNILEAIVARAKDQGGVSADLVNGNAAAGESQTAAQDQYFDEAEGSVAQAADNIEKAAAVSALVEAGCDFYDAISMVKQAEESLAEEADQQEKMAAVSTLVEAGYDFDTAIQLVKQAEAELNGTDEEMEKAAAVEGLMADGYSFEDSVELVKQAISNPSERVSHPGTRGKIESAAYQAKMKARRYARELAAKAKSFGSSTKSEATNAVAAAKGLKNSPRYALQSLGNNKLVQGVADATGLAGLAGGAYALAHRKHEKKAALDTLIDAGIDFDSAVNLVTQAEYDVYGN